MANQIQTIEKNLKIVSYNSNGFGFYKQAFVADFDLFSDIILLQEHFLLQANVYKISNVLCNYDLNVQPALKPANVISGGRASGGLCILWKKNLCDKVDKVLTNNSRIVANIFHFGITSLLIMNCYFPNDPQTTSYSDDKLFTLLNDIKVIIDCYDFNHFIIAGDLNCDFSRNTGFVNIINDFLSSHDLISTWNLYDISHTYTHTDGVSKSKIDHFIVNENNLNSIKDAGILNISTNKSPHSPIFMNYIVNCSSNVSDDVNCSTNVSDFNDKTPLKNKYIFKNATDIELCNWKNYCDINLMNLTFSNICNDYNCTNHSCHDNIDDNVSNLIKILNNSCVECIPSIKPAVVNDNKHCIPGWKEHVAPFKLESDYHRAIWISAGKPMHDFLNYGNYHPLYVAMKHYRNQYHFAIRRLKKSTDLVKHNNMLNSCILGGSDIFNEIKKLRKNNSFKVNNIDGFNNDNLISNHFAGKYDKLYNSLSNDKYSNDLIKLNNTINESINDVCIIDILHKFNVYSVRNACLKLKIDKSDVNEYFPSNCFIKAPFSLYEKLYDIFVSFFVHGYVSSILLGCALTPIVKNKLGNLCNSDNYRAIAISSLFLKIFDLCIIDLCKNELVNHDLQFAYQVNSSTTLCSWAALEVANYFVCRKSAVYACILDCTKAFDNVNFVKLFTKLLSCKVNCLIIRCLLFIYMNQYCFVRWNGYNSDQFGVSNGVRQGAILSPLLFSLYLNDLIEILCKSQIGCKIGPHYYGIFVYADDIILMCPSRTGLQSMIDICSNYAFDHDLTFSIDKNPLKSKSKCIVFDGLVNSKSDPHDIFLNNMKLPWVRKILHLGHHLNSDLSLEHDMLAKRGIFISKFHELLQEFSYANPLSLLKIVNIYCTSFYGSNLWDLDNCNKLYNQWNCCIRKIWNLPCETHKYFIDELSTMPHIKVQLFKRFYKFCCSIDNSCKPSIQFLFNLLKNKRYSLLGKNIYSLCKFCNVQSLNDIKNIDFRNLNSVLFPENEKWRLPLLWELINDLYFDKNMIDFENETDIYEFLNYVCTS